MIGGAFRAKPSQTRAANSGPFDLGDAAAYRDWRTAKLQDYPRDSQTITVRVRDVRDPAPDEIAAVLGHCRKTNMAFYETAAPAGPDAVRAFGRHLGLSRIDTPLYTDDGGVTAIEAGAGGRRDGYIPYTNRPLSWHTDGYYNQPGGPVRAVILHCVRAAERGGETTALDPEIAYIRLRDADPAFIAALMAADVLTIPANREDGRELRGESRGPVFSVDAASGALHMRYTARARNARWKADSRIPPALALLKDVLENDPCLFRHRLLPGQGLVGNNVLHRRSGFDDDADPDRRRLMYRARYRDRIGDTGLNVP